MHVMSAGRFELGLGGGAFWDAVRGMGGTVRGRGEGLPALEEAIDLIRGALDIGPERRVVRSDGRFFPEHMYPPGPPPAHRVEIWVGAMSSGAMRLIGRKADGWVAGGGISRAAEFHALMARIDDAAVTAGRDPSVIRRIVNVSGTPAEDVAALRDSLAWLANDVGINGFAYWAPDAGTGQIDRFAMEVVPALQVV
jgi:alkanesulfonate monooxygenase SsuD/methylene tetrahydromethanopterin reductase-like flavin-dependent oxidoreductase (luciferase family)